MLLPTTRESPSKGGSTPPILERPNPPRLPYRSHGPGVAVERRLNLSPSSNSTNAPRPTLARTARSRREGGSTSLHHRTSPNLHDSPYRSHGPRSRPRRRSNLAPSSNGANAHACPY